MTPTVPSGATSTHGNHDSVLEVSTATGADHVTPSADVTRKALALVTGAATSWVPARLSVKVRYSRPVRGSAAIVPPVGTRTCRPVSVCRPFTLSGKSRLPSSWSTTCTGSEKVAPPSREVTTRYWSSNCSPGSQAASCWLFWKATWSTPPGPTRGAENWSSSHAPAGPEDLKLSDRWMTVPCLGSNTVIGSLPMTLGPRLDMLPVRQVRPPSKVV